jgi:hypothetical protein
MANCIGPIIAALRTIASGKPMMRRFVFSFPILLGQMIYEKIEVDPPIDDTLFKMPDFH